MLLIEFFNFFWLQFLYLGLLRPKSKDAKAITVGKEGEKAAYDVIKNKKSELGSMSFHETLVAIFFLLAVLLWFFRKPQFIPGWAEMLTKTTVTKLNKWYCTPHTLSHVLYTPILNTCIVR